MQIIIRKKLISFNIFILKYILFNNCNYLPILSKIEITIDFNGHEGPILLLKYSKIEQ